MALNFPSSPSINDTYTYGDKTWVWNGRFWQIQAAGAINDIAIGNITPNTGAFTTLTATGNITASGNVQGQYILGNGAFLTGISSSYGNANVANYLPNYGGNILTNVASGNFYANSILPWSPTAGLINDAVDIGNSTLYFKDIYVGNVITPAGDQGNATQIQPASGAGQSGVAFVDAITGSASDVSAGTLYVESIDATGNVIVDTFVEANEIIALSNVSGTGGNFSGNVSASYFLGNGAFLTGIAAGYSNANVANYLPNYQGLVSNIDFRSTSPAAVAMVVTDRPITIGGNTLSYVTIPNDGNANSVAAELTNHGLGNVLISSGPDDHEWIFDNTGNLTAPGNIQAGNAVSANYFLGNGALLTGITTNYSNANVANYLATYNGNALFSNVTVSQNAVILGNLRVEGNTTYINVTDLVIEDKDIIVAANATATLTDLNGAGLQIGNRTAGGNITFFYDSTSNVMALSHGANIANVLNVSGNVTAANISGNYFIGNGALLTGIVTSSYSNANVANYLPTYSGNITAGNIAVTGNVTANWFVGNINTTNSLITSGNVTANNFIGSDPNVNLIAGSYTWAFNDAGNLVLPSNTFAVNYANGVQVSLGGSYSNADVANYLASNAAVTILTTGNITTSANIAGNYFIGNGALLTGVVTSSYSNANVANYLPTYTGNITAGNVAVTGNVTSGNVTANNFIGSEANTSIVANIYTWTFNSTGNLVLPGNTFAVTYANGVQVSLGGSYSNADVANYLPTFTGNVGAGNLNLTGNIIDTGALNIITGASGNITLAPGNSNVLIARTTGANITGTLGVTGNVDAGNFNVTGNIVDTGALTIITGASGNITLSPGNTSVLIARTTGANVTGTLGVTGNITGGNISTTIVSATGNVSGGNITTTGVVTATGNITGGNIVTTGIVSATGNVNAGNLNITGNIVDTGALTIITGASGNVSLAPGNTSVLVATTTGVNVSGTFNSTGSFVTAGNVTANNLIGTGVNTSIVSNNYTWTFNSEGNFVLPGNTFGVTYANGTAVSLGGSYGNADVANYLPTYNGNALFSNVTVSQDAVILGNLRVEGNTTYINVTDLVIEDKDIIVAANATATLTDLNGAGLQIGNRTAGGNITFFYNSTSNVMALSHGANIANVLNVAGNITATGNVNTGNLVGSGTNVEIVGGSYTWTFNGSGNLVLPGNSFAVNYANGAQVSLGGSYSNADVKAYLGNFDGNIIPSANITYDLGSNTNRWNDLYLNNSTIYIGAQEITANADSTIFSGNLAVGNLVGTGDNVDIKAGAYTWRFDNAGNLTLPANTSAINYANGTSVPVGYGNASVAAYLGSNANLTILSQGNITGNYFIGNGALLTGVVTSSYSNANVANYLPTYTGNIAAGNVTATGNVQGAYLLGNGALLTGLPATYGNSNVAAYLASNANVTLAIGTGNITTQGNLSVGNLIGSGDNVDLKAGSYTWRFDSTGNLTLPANATAIYYANGTQVPVGYGNANVATYLSSNANVTVLVGTGNITTQGNISGNYFIGNGALLTGIVTSSYSNANVANYLASNANLTISVGTGNITTQGNIQSRSLYVGSQQDVIYQVSGNITLAGGGLDNNANISIRANTAMANSYVLSLPSDTPNAGDVLSVKNFGSWSGVGNVANLIWSAPASTYGNTNVAAYLQAYNGNALFSNVTVSRDVLILGNLRVEGNTTEINVSNIFLEDKDIIVAANANATLSDLNGAGLQIGNRTAGGNVTFFYNSISNVMSLSHGANIANVLNVDGNIVATGNVTGNYILGNGALLTGLATYGNSNVAAYLASNANVTVSVGTGNITTQGNLTAGNFIGSGSNVRLESENYAWQFDNAGNLTLPGNTFSVNYANGAQVSLSGSYSNANVANYLASNANLTISVGTGNITTQGNVSGNYFIGNGALLTGIATGSYSNANVANYLPTYSGNITAGNIAVTGNVTANWFVGNINTTNSLVTSGNVTANNFIGSAANTRIVANIYTWTFNNTGNLVLPGNTFGVTYANGVQVSLGGSYGNADVANYLASNANLTISVGTGNITTQGNLAVGNLIGAGNNVEITAGAYTWTLDNTGNLTLPGNTTAINYANGTPVPVGYGNSNVAAYLASNANVTVSVGTGNITTQGNVSGNYFIGNGALLTGVVTSSYSNANVANYLPTYSGNITAGNIAVTGNVTANWFVGNINATNTITTTGNVTANNFIGSAANTRIVSNIYTWTFNSAGNFVLPGNTFSVNYANGVQVSLGGSYSNADVANYLASNANLTIAVGTGNITTQGNLAVGNLIGSGNNVEITAGAYTWTLDNTGNLTLPGNATAIYYANGTQVPVGYGNTNVATYLASNAAVTILTTANITTAANISGAYILGNGAFLSGLPATYSNSNVAAYLAAYNGNALFSNITVSQDAVILGNLRVEGNTTYINVSDLIVEDKDIIVAANASATLTDLNGAGLQIGNRSAGGNITFFYNSTSNVMSLSHGANIANILNVAGNVTATGNVNTGNLVGSGTNVEIVSGAYTWLFDGAGNLTGTGNVSAGNFVGTSGNTSIVTANYTWTFNSAGNLVLPGNVFGVTYANGAQVSLGGSYSNADVANYLASNANVTVLVGTGNVTTQGNISGNYFIGNGALLTGVVTSSYSNANVANYLPTYTGNITAGNITTTGNVTGNWFVGNVSTTNSLVTSGNVTANNFVGSSGNTSIVTAGYTWVFNDTGNFVLPGNSFSVNYANGAQVSLGGSYSNADVKAYLGNFDGNIIPSANVTYNLGSNSNRWNDLYLNNSTIYIGAQEITANADATIFSGNISANYILGNGALLTGVASSYGNANVADYLASNANINLAIGTGNITTAGNISVGSIQGANANTTIVANVYSWTFDDTGNLTLPGNSTAIYLANGTQVPLGYNNASVADYMGSNANVTLSIGTGNITTQGNIKSRTLYLGSHQDVSYQAYGNITLSGGSADNNSNVSIVANGAMTTSYVLKLPADTPNAGDVLTVKNFGSQLLFGNVANLIWSAPAGSYTNANVANYLVTYNANALFSNVTVSQDAVILGNLRVEGNTTYINVSDLIVEDKDIIVAANASATLTDLNGAGLQIGNRSAGGNITFFYNSTSNVMTLSHGANIANVLNVAGNITANSLTGSGSNVEIVGGSYTWTFNGSGNLVLPGNAFSVNYANGAQVSLGGSYSNAEAASYLASNANVTILTGVANITTQGNVAAGYLLGNATFADGVSNTYFGNVTPSSPAQGDIWINSDTAVQLIYFVDANGGQWAEMEAATSYSYSAGGDYTDSNVTALLASLGANTISSSANITTSANISAGYILGNGSQLTGLDFTNYTNSNVANYLVSYNANALFSNVTVSSDMVIIGNLRVEGNTTEINVSNIFLEDKDIIVAANASATLSDLNGAGLQIGNITAGGNITFFYDSTSNVMTLSHGANIANVLNVAGNISAANITATGNITGNTNGFTIGYRDVPQVSWSNATMALADASKHYYTSTGGVTLTVPSNANVAFPIGATIAFYNRSSANCTIAPQASVNIFVVGNSTITPTANRTITSNGGGTLTKVDTNTWMLSAANVV